MRFQSSGENALGGRGAAATAGLGRAARRSSAGWSRLRPAMYWINPKLMPTPAHANPRCQSIPSAILPATIGPSSAPTLMPI